jgi:hypothetical protein
MASIALYILAYFLQGTPVPYKAKEEFEILIDYQFKNRSAADALTVDYSETKEDQDKKRYGAGVRPYLILNMKILKLSNEEIKVRAINTEGRTVYNKKVIVGDIVKFDMGFTDDIKDRVGPYAVTVVFLSKDKKETSRIYLYVHEDGTFLVNEEVRGKF